MRAVAKKNEREREIEQETNERKRNRGETERKREREGGGKKTTERVRKRGGERKWTVRERVTTFKEVSGPAVSKRVFHNVKSWHLWLYICCTISSR